MSAELLTLHEFRAQMSKGSLPVVHRYILFFPRLPARWTAPSFRAITNKQGELVRNPKTGCAVLARFKKGEAGKQERAWQQEVHDAIRKEALPWADPKCFALRVSIVVRYPAPKSMPQKRRGVPQPKLTAPDITNLRKTVEDALQGAICSNDAIIFSGYIEKWIAAQHQRPGTYLIIEYLPRWATEATR